MRGSSLPAARPGGGGGGGGVAGSVSTGGRPVSSLSGVGGSSRRLVNPSIPFSQTQTR